MPFYCFHFIYKMNISKKRTLFRKEVDNRDAIQENSLFDFGDGNACGLLRRLRQPDGGCDFRGGRSDMNAFKLHSGIGYGKRQGSGMPRGVEHAERHNGRL